MRPHINSFFKACAELLPCPEPNVEVGAYQVAGQETIADLRPHFPGKTYIGCDMRLGRGVDRIEDIHALSFQDGDAIFAQALMQFPIHSYPEDYWWFIPAVPFDNWLGPLLALPSFVVETTRPLKWQRKQKTLKIFDHDCDDAKLDGFGDECSPYMGESSPRCFADQPSWQPPKQPPGR